MSFSKFWNSSAKKYPVFTMVITNGTLAATGNILAQSLSFFSDENKEKHKSFFEKFELSQTVRFFAYGMMFAPFSFKWFSYLDRRFPFRSISPSVKPKKNFAYWSVVGKRLSADQLLFSPLAAGAFIAVMGAMEKKSLQEIKERFNERYFKTLIGSYILWPAVQVINFSIIPLIYRVPFAGVASVIWNCFLSILNARHKENAFIAEELELLKG
ncbi:hypothetical protein BB559_001101 [Furculomyces boomerangus]|uniref:Protein SYM1 n=2 Tax=Harpellales TaxID=61421 RepID=A0A2T9Z382_9FUNG|nr:hypothetical protein BB559_007062 [Furculomyces boomerangus]PVU98996.1 hypothetical protein BB559_001101 [Furculomyces boomerangus]PVZ97776.1 hypothetical protein BB558_006253 [Smittium angustum]